MLFDTTQFALEAAISGASTRQQALASNLANVNTPGYQRVDVDFHGSLAAGSTRRSRAKALGARADHRASPPHGWGACESTDGPATT